MDNQDEMSQPEESGVQQEVSDVQDAQQVAPEIQQETPGVQTEPEKTKGIPKSVWFIGGGCLLLLCAAVCVGLGIYLWSNFFGGGDIASVVPNDSLVYVSVDLTNIQSESVDKVANVFQDLAEVDDKKTAIESLDESMDQEYGMSFTEDVLPWVGQHGAFVITDGDLTSEDFEFMFIAETRNKSKADEFLTKFVAAAADKQDMTFETSERDKITFYTYKSDYDSSQDVILARVGNFVYFSNSEDAIVKSADLKKADSLADDQNYKDGISALSGNSIVTMYFGPDAYVQAIEGMGSDFFYGSGVPLSELENTGIAGFAMGMSVEDAGVRFDFAAVYDEANMSDFQKDMFNITYSKSQTDTLLPGDTFFFLGVNSSQNFGRYLQEDSPLYDQDVQESFDLLEKEYGVSITDLFNLLNGEFSLAIGPANDGMPVDLGEINMGVTILVGTNDEEGFTKWFENAIDAAFTSMYTDYKIEDTTIGGYALQELSIDDYSGMIPALYYGADNGYVVLGTSKGILEDGLSQKNTLADNATYAGTWNAFPSGSVPYMYLDVQGFVSFLKESDPNTFSGSESVEKGLKRIPVVAVSMNKPNGNVRSQTLIVFIK